MTAAVRLSRRSAQALAEYLEPFVMPTPEFRRALDELRRALAPRPRSSQVRKTEAKRREKAKETRKLYFAAQRRANGACEACHDPFDPLDPPELDHWKGRGKAKQTEETVWLIHRSCHKARHAAEPSRTHWVEVLQNHCQFHGYDAEVEDLQAELDAESLTQKAADLTRRPA